MNQNILVFTRDQNLLGELSNRLPGGHSLVPCETLDGLPDRVKAQPINAVLVHLEQKTLNGYSPVRFISELDSVIDDAPLYGLMDENCPPRLKRLAERAIDDCLDFPLDYGRLGRLLDLQQSAGDEQDAFWRNLPHKELRGATRSLTTFTPEMFDMIGEIQVAARHNVTVLLIGETGSGKTFLARLIHELSGRREDRFCTVACGALPPDLIESELFGYVKGAFTGADKDREGKFAAAGSGTLLLDEIDVLPPEQQAKLLRVIETGEYEPVGSNETQHSRARLIVASNYDLEDLVRAGSFRTDLYYRLNNVVGRAVLYCQRGVLTVQDLPSSIRPTPFNTTTRAIPSSAAPTAIPSKPISASAPPASAVSQPTKLEDRVDSLEQRIIEDSLKRNNFRRKQTAAELGISRVTLYNKMKKFGLM